MSQKFNLEDEFGPILDGIVTYIDENPDEFLEHNGVKGMKWGKRKAKPKSDRPELKGLGPDRIVRKTKSGEEITLSKNPPTALHKGLARISKGYRESYENGAFLTIHDSSGKRVGDAMVDKKSNDELYLNWLGIDKSSRGKGYATAVMKSAADFGKEAGFKKMTLEVPGNAPDALHIYEKLGFKKTGEMQGHKDDIWGGLTNMEYVFADVKHSQVDDFLAHYGIPGMKWGKRGGGKKDKPAMSRKKKVAIAVGTGAVVAIGAAVTMKALSKNGNIPMSNIMDRPSVKRGQQNSKQASQESKPKVNAGTHKAPKPPSPYPMTPIIATPVLDEIMRKYNL